MKKFLSLVLALAMAMSLVVVNTSAKEFTDDADVTYDEAVAVISEIGVVDGYTDGSFNPTNGLTRGAAAKIICNLILGPTTAAELHADTAPYSDVSISNEFAGYIAYCAKEGIISGYADGTFRPANPLTGYAFMKMLLGALGYDQYTEGYTGENWSISVAKRAIGIGLNKGLVDEFNGVDYVTREEAALYAFNTLQADLVEYDTVITTTINGQNVTIGNSVAQSKKWGSSATRINNIKNDEYIQFAEQYFNKLVKVDDTDAFMRPAYTWTYAGTEIGTYVDWTQMVQEYTTKVTCKELYNLLTKSTIDRYDFAYYVDGAEPDGTQVLDLVKNDLYRTNNDTAGSTGNGVLTQVFVDDDNKEVVITSINTYLAQANTDYNAKSETISMTVYNDGTGTSKTVDVDDVPAIADLKEDDFFLVTWAGDTINVRGKDVQTVSDVEVMSDVTVSKFSKDKNDDYSNYNQVTTDRVTKLTTGGTEYDHNVKAYYEAATLGDYYGDLLVNKTYDVYLDQYGYFIGVALHSGDDQYVFIAAYDVNNSAMGIVNADALAIFPDGTMKQIKVNTKDTNTNIGTTTGYAQWTTSGGSNRWYSYSVDNDVYTLSPVKGWTMEYAQNGEMNIQTDRLALSNTETPSTGKNKGTGRSFGNDESVYITVERNTTVSWGDVIDEVTGVYTGIQDVRLNVSQGDFISAVYDKDNYIIAAIVVGEAEGAVDNYAYILSGAKSEARDSDGYQYWTFDAILNGTIQTMTIKSKFSSTVNSLVPNTVEELVLDGDGYVTKINTLPNNNTNVNNGYDKGVNEVYDNAELNAYLQVTDYSVYDVNCSVELTLKNRTLHIDPTYDHNGLFFASDAKAVVSQWVNGSRDEVEYSSVQAAYSTLADSDNNTANGLTFNGRIVAVLDANGVAQWVFFYDNTQINSGNKPSYSGNVQIMNLTGTNGQFSATVATNSTIAGSTTWQMKVYQGNVQVADSGVKAGGAFNANVGYPLTATTNVPVSGNYRVVVTIWDSNNVVAASGEANFTI